MQNILIKMFTMVLLHILSALPSHCSPLYHQLRKNSKPYTYLLLASASNDVPMIQSNNFDMIMADDNYPMESIQYQNFESFHEPMVDNSDFSMDESQFLPRNTPLRAPQPLSKKEREIRQLIEVADPSLESRKMLKLKKGSSVPRGPEAYPWDQFDYDLYSVNPLNQKKH